MQATSWKSIALVLAGIILGCGANAVRGAHAEETAFPSSASAKTWQQYCVDVDDSDELNDRVRAAGSEGFEVVTASVRASNTDDFIVCFKRPAA